jgi:hypothetical protein
MRKGKGKFQNRSKYGSNRGVSTVWDLGRLRPVEGEQPVESSPKSIAELMHREQVAAQANEAAKQRERDNAKKIEHDTRLREYWGVPDASTLMTSPIGMRDDYSGLEVGNSVPDSGTAFLKELEQQGVTVTLAFKQRTGKYIESQNKHLGAAINLSNLRRTYLRLKELGCFGSGEVIEPRPVQVETQPEKTLTVEDVLRTVDTTTKDGSALLKKVVDQQWAKELDPLVSGWFEQLSRDYSIIVSRDVAQYLFGPAGWFSTRGLAINAENLNAARRHLTARGVWDARTTQEQLDLRLQRNEIGRPEYMFLCNRCLSAGVLNRPVKEATAKGLL